MADETEQTTLQDLFRVMNDMRGEMNARFEQVDARFDDLRSEMNHRFDEAQAERAKLQDEASIIRTDMLELASHKDFVGLDDKIAIIANDSKATRQDVRNIKSELSRLKADVKKAGIPVS